MNRIPIKVSTSYLLKQHMDDGDYTQDFLDAGTKLNVAGPVNVDNIPVTKAWVKDDVLYVEGEAIFPEDDIS